MKKSIGLTADISTFNTTLPQTRHLNYFMGTNPRRYANGGDVSQGIPNYPNPNVTSGFLPMALGFDSGGEANSSLLQQIDKLMLLFGGDIKKVIEYLKKFFGYSQEDIDSALNQKDAQPPTEQNQNQTPGLMPTDTVAPTPSDRQPGIGISNNMPPIVPSDRQGAFDNVPLQPLPKISTEQQQREFEDSQKPMGPIPKITPPNDGGITTIDPEKLEPKEELPFYLKAFDLNGDGEVNIEDYNIAKEKGLSIADAIKKYIDGFVEPLPTEPKDLPEIEINPSLEDDKDDTKKDDTKKIKPSVLTPPPQNQNQTPGLMPPEGGITEITKEDQDTFKKYATLDEGGDGGGITDKKDVPSWALPMMSAGFAMMASKSPYFMQALGEAGQAGVETYSAQKTAEEDKLDKEATRDQSKAMAEYYRGEGRQGAGTMKIMNGVWHKLNPKTNEFDPMTLKGGAPAKVTITRQDAIDYLRTNDPNFAMGTYEYQQEAIQKHMDLYNETNNQIIEKNKEEGGGFNLLNIPEAIYKYWEGFTKKDGGIVTLRR